MTKTQVLANGHTMISGSTVIPINMASNTAGSIMTQDIVAGNATAFPQLAAVVKNYDKISWRRMNVRFAPTLPTTAGGSVGMYFDTDRTDAPPTSITQVMQNKGSRMGATWDRQTLPVPAKQLNGVNKWYSTITGSDTAKENTFISPGRIHTLVTSLPGVTVSASTIVGYLHLDFIAELGFPTNPVDSTVPARRTIPKSLQPVNSCTIEPQLVHAYNFFAAGCMPVPDFYTFIAALRNDGTIDLDALSRFNPDLLSLRMTETDLFNPASEQVLKVNFTQTAGSRAVQCEIPESDLSSLSHDNEILSRVEMDYLIDRASSYFKERDEVFNKLEKLCFTREESDRLLEVIDFNYNQLNEVLC
jgi:hypothetical protein